jgi:4-amino-4-deoxy-L-arabinose transferase-like glycosyltransferase
VSDLLREKWTRIDNWPVSSHLWLVILIAFLVFSLQVWKHGDQVPAIDAVGHIQHAVGLNKDTTFGYSRDASGVTEPAMFHAPLQMFVVAGAMSLDGNLAESLRCIAWAEKPGDCKTSFGAFFLLQALILTLVPFFTWLMAWQLSGKKAVAWGAVVLVLLSGRPALYTTLFLTEVYALPLFAGLLFCLVAAIQSRFWFWFVAVGTLCGLLVMTKPAFAYLFYALLLVLSYWRAANGQNSRLFWTTLGFLALPYLVIVGPWMWRNYVLFDTTSLTQGYGAWIMAQRLAYNMMTGLELSVSFVYWLPDFGDRLAAALYPPEAWRRLDLDAQDGFYLIGNSDYLQQTLAAAGSKANHLSYLINEELWPNIIKHIAVTFALAWRGLWVAGYWGLIMVPLALAYGAVAASRRRTDILMPLFACGFMLGLYAFVSISLPRYSDLYVPLISVMVAMLVNEWARHKQQMT